MLLNGRLPSLQSLMLLLNLLVLHNLRIISVATESKFKQRERETQREIEREREREKKKTESSGHP